MKASREPMEQEKCVTGGALGSHGYDMPTGRSRTPVDTGKPLGIMPASAGQSQHGNVRPVQEVIW